MALADASAALLRGHLGHRPLRNPVTQWRAAFPAHLDVLAERGETFFHPYSFNLMRQFGANFELLSKYLLWLKTQGFEIPASIPAAAQTIASEAMVMQFRLVRSVARHRRGPVRRMLRHPRIRLRTCNQSACRAGPLSGFFSLPHYLETPCNCCRPTRPSSSRSRPNPHRAATTNRS